MTWTTRPRSDIGGLAAITCGTGTNVLLLHGVGLQADAWDAQLDALPGHKTAPDMPGHGGSPLPASTRTMSDYVAAAAGVLDALDGTAVVIGHSMGAMIALELAACRASKVLAVAALNAVFERSADAANAVQARAAELDGKTRPDPTVTLTRWFGDMPSAERTACRDWLLAVDPAGYKHAYSAFAHSEVPARAALRRLSCPALFMTGAEEPNSTPEMSRTMADLAPNGRSVIVQGAAHMMPMTHSEQVNAALTGLIEQVRP